MFQKPTFGSTTAGFGSFNTTASTSSPFGGFKAQPGTSAFGAAPAFGATAAPQPAQTGSFFGATSTTGGLFGAAPVSTPSTFGASTSGGFGFAAQNTSTGLFGAQNTSTGLFGATQPQTNTGFGAKPPGFGFGATSVAPTTGGGLFGGTQTSGLFGQQPAPMGTSTLFSNTGFGQQSTATGTAHVKYNPVVGTDVMVKSGNSQNINIKHHCITCMKEYENKSLEELRLEDYVAGNKGGSAAAGGLFAAKPLFGGTGAFGQPATTAAPAANVFGTSALGTTGFGQTTLGQNNTFAFGGNTAQTNTTTNLFGANKPAFGATSAPGTTNLFGATTTQAPAFGTNTSTFGFGGATQNQTTSLFNTKPTTGFGAAAPASGFGFGGGGLFNKPAQPASSAPTPFGTTTPAFGTTTSTAGGLFNNTFKPPAQTSFGFGGNTQTNTGLGTLGSGLGASFQSKPGGTAFPSLNTTGSSMFNTQSAPTLNFNTGNTSLGSGLGTGLGFGNTSLNSTLGALGQTNTMGTLGNPTLGATAGCNVHEQILNLAARPYGDWPLFKDLPDTSTTAEDILKPTAPGAIASVLARSPYRVSTDASAVKLRPHTYDHKKSLFDGLEESDASLEDKLSLKPSRKRLVLRPQKNRLDAQNSVNDSSNNNNRSLEDPSHRDTNTSHRSTELNNTANTSTDAPKMNNSHADESARSHAGHEDVLRGVNTDLEDSSDRLGSRLGSPKLPWSGESKKKPVDNQFTPRLYPDLDRDIQASERRASWLTTKPLRIKSLIPEQEAQDSVRELITERRAHNKENIDLTCVSEEEHVSPRDMAPHPTGVKLTRPGYYTVPSLDDMISYIRPDGRCVLPHLTVGRRNYGNVYYDCEIDVTGLDLDNLVHFLNKEVIIYPTEVDKPPVGVALNQRAIVTLDRVWPRDKTEKRPVTDPDRLQKMEYEAKLRRVCDKHDTKFIEYRPQTGSWVFRVEHFSKYGLTDSDEEDDITPEVMKRQLVNQSLQKNAAPVQKPMSTPLPVGLGGLMAPEDNLFAMQQSSLSLLSNAGKAFEMDTTEDNNNTEAQSMYPEINRAFGVKSPTSELARLENRQSHSVQLMKASLYADTEMEDEAMSASTGDQLVPSPAATRSLAGPILLRHAPDDEKEQSLLLQPAVSLTEEIPMKPLLVIPHTIVLKYHRKVPPFKQTIAGKLDAACIADMSICRARHSRVGFGPGNTLVFVTTANNMAKREKVAEMSQLNKYVCGRGVDDWSEPVVARLGIGHAHRADNIEESLSGHLQALLDFSTLCSEGSSKIMPRLEVKASPRDRRALLDRHLAEARTNDRRKASFGVSDSYCHQVWSLCEALWGADLENGGVPGTDELSIVNRHKSLLDWLTAATADDTDKDLRTPTKAEEEDEMDTHSSRVLTLLLGGRLLEACKVAREAKDYNMAAMLAQASGDETIRSLIARQLQSWQACGADAVIASSRRVALGLLCGERPHARGWLNMCHITARYLCPQVPTLEQIITKYEGFFRQGPDEEEVDLTLVEEERLDLDYPVPPYQTEFDISVLVNGKKRRVLDLRYELMRARAFNTRPRLQPAGYTPHPLDYSLCFLLGAWFGNLSTDSITGIAAQLEAAGAWHLAVQACAYHGDDVARTHLVRGILSRQLPARAAAGDEPRMALLRRLRVPTTLIDEAMAHRAKYQHEPHLEAEHLLAAGQFNASHKVLLDELLPMTVLADDLESIAPLLEKMNAAAKRNEISGWEKGGLALYHYLHVCSEIRTLVCRSQESPTASRVEALRPRVVAACRALHHYTAKSPRSAAARAEMGARLVQSALAAGEPAAHLASLLRTLKLPPDCTAHAVYKMTTELADQAAEECATGSILPLPILAEAHS